MEGQVQGVEALIADAPPMIQRDRPHLHVRSTPRNSEGYICRTATSVDGSGIGVDDGGFALPGAKDGLK